MSLTSRPALTGDRCQCSGCNLCFTSTSSFDSHRIGTGAARRCLTESELRAKHYEPNTQGLWRKPMTDDQLAASIARHSVVSHTNSTQEDHHAQSNG
jgi:hypothetical protein